MKIAAIKKLVETYTLEQCKEAEASLTEGNPLPIAVEGDDEGEQLTHILGAIDILERMQHEQKDARTALREFMERVRSCIS